MDTETQLIEANRTTALPDGSNIIYPSTNALGDFQGTPQDANTNPSYIPSSWLNLINRFMGRLLLAKGVTPSSGITPAQLSSAVSPYWQEGGDYLTGDVKFHNGKQYICTAPHRSSPANAPGVEGAPWVSYSLVLRHPFGQPVQTWDFVDANSLPYWLIAANGQTLAVSQHTRLIEYLNSIGRIKNKADYDAGFSADFWAVQGNDLFVPNASGLFYRNSGGLADAVGRKQLDRGRNVTGITANIYFTANTNSFTGPFIRPTDFSNTGNGDVGNAGIQGGMGFDASRVWGAEHTGKEFNPTNTARLPVINIKIEV